MSSDTFDERMRKLANEITALKAAKIKAATEFETVSKSISITLSTELFDFFYASPTAAIITVTPTKDVKPMATCTLNLTTVGSELLNPVINRQIASDGSIIFVVYIAYYDQAATFNWSVTVTSTCDFTYTLGYEELDWEY